MAKLSINLLPPELEAAKKQKNKFSAALKLSIIFMIIVIGVATVVLSLRLSQNVVLSNVNKDLEKAKTTLSSPTYNQKEGLVITLKNRLDSLGILLGQETFASYAFSLISSLVPQDIRLSSFSIDNKGIIKISLESNNIASLETFLNQIVTPDSTQKKVTSVNLDSISLNNGNLYRTELSIVLVGAISKPK